MYAAFALNETEAYRLCDEWASSIRSNWTIQPVREIHRNKDFGPLKSIYWAAPAIQKTVPNCTVRILEIKAKGEFATWPYDRYQGKASAKFMVMFPA